MCIRDRFLNYRAAIPKEFEHEVSADRQELIQCIERVSLIVSEKDVYKRQMMRRSYGFIGSSVMERCALTTFIAILRARRSRLSARFSR